MDPRRPDTSRVESLARPQGKSELAPHPVPAEALWARSPCRPASGQKGRPEPPVRALPSVALAVLPAKCLHPSSGRCLGGRLLRGTSRVQQTCLNRTVMQSSAWSSLDFGPRALPTQRLTLLSHGAGKRTQPSVINYGLWMATIETGQWGCSGFDTAGPSGPPLGLPPGLLPLSGQAGPDQKLPSASSTSSISSARP